MVEHSGSSASDIAQEAVTDIGIDQIRVDGGTQSRAQIDAETVDSYLADMQAGAVFPPVTVFYDGADYWLADGFHRLAARKKTKLGTIQAEVKAGSRGDAVLHAAGANTRNGLRRTNADKRRAVEMVLRLEEWSKKNDSEIARQCGVSQPFVGKLRASYNGYETPPDPVRKVERGGKVFEMDTSNIGKKKASTSKPSERKQKPGAEPEAEPQAPALAVVPKRQLEESRALAKASAPAEAVPPADDKVMNRLVRRLQKIDRLAEPLNNEMWAAVQDLEQIQAGGVGGLRGLKLGFELIGLCDSASKLKALVGGAA